MRSIILLIVPVMIFIFLSDNIFAQIERNDELHLSGNLLVDSEILLDAYQQQQANFKLNEPEGKKSPVLAGVMSAVVPGSGELYTGEYLKAAIFFVVEAALITTAVVYDNKGDNQTAEFEAFADEHWSVVKYSEYLLDHKAQLGIPDDCEIPISDDNSLPPWERIEDWNALNHCESRFSHHLPPHGEQQYYELIGKYYQFAPGWDEFDQNIHNFGDVPQIMKDYAVMRGNANNSYNISDTAIIGLYINHILSVIDAVWSATSFNKDLAVKMRVQNVYFANGPELVPTLNLQYSF